MKQANELAIKLFGDGADIDSILELYKKPYIKGFTTNPTLMQKAGISDYAEFARKLVKAVPDRPISFEVFADEFSEMERQALIISEWGKNVYVKIPITNTKREASYPLIEKLAGRGLKLNVTAMMTLQQVAETARCLAKSPASYISVFAGRIADTGRDPVPMMAAAIELMRPYPQLELIWASPRELLNIYQAESIGCHVITVTPDVLKKLSLVGKDLDDYSLETVKMFYDDGKKAGFRL
jgi:transaldolase